MPPYFCAIIYLRLLRLFIYLLRLLRLFIYLFAIIIYDYLRKDKISKTTDLANGMTSTNSRRLSISVITQVRVSWTVPLK